MDSTKREKELFSKISEQEEQLARYKKRLQDVVVAHKKLIAEKERLEESLKAITASIAAPKKESDLRNSDEEIDGLNAKISGLAVSLSSLTDEKRQLEAQFQLERKQLVQQNTFLEDKLRNLDSLIANTKKSQEAKVDSVKTQLNLENNQRELDFSSNIRELQNIISKERKKRDEKKVRIENLEKQLKETSEKLNESIEKEKRVQQELENTRKQLEIDNTPQIVMEKLKRELQLMKEQHNYAVHQEQMRASKAEERSRKLEIEHESRVSKLEQKLAQFSDLAGNYDKHRQEDQETIMILKNRLMQLEVENSSTRCEDDRSSVNEETLFQQLQHIKHQLILNCKSSSQLNNFREILLDGVVEGSKENSDYKERYILLKQQFEEYLQKSNEDGKAMKHKIHHLKTKIKNLEELNVKFQKEVEIANEYSNELVDKERQLWKGKLLSIESEYRNNCIALEKELEKQRERVVTIVEEKGKQLAELQQHYFPGFKLPDEISNNNKKVVGSGARRQTSTLIYYLEDTARKEADIARLRKSNNELQNQLHDLERELFHQMQLYAQLQQDIERLEKNEGAEELNNTYLKNVFLNYMLTLDPKMRSHMLNAIFAILKFSDFEINRIVKLKQQN